MDGVRGRVDGVRGEVGGMWQYNSNTGIAIVFGIFAVPALRCLAVQCQLPADCPAGHRCGSPVRGVDSEGLSTTVHPAARAGDTLRVIIEKGKFLRA
jgi:hypothetical protein